MNSHFEIALKLFFENRPDLFGENSEYSYFELELDENYSGDGGYTSALTFGRICYRQEAKNFMSDSYVIKRMGEKVAYLSVPVILNFNNENFFYTQMLPFLNEFCPISSFFPKYYGSDLRLNVFRKDGLMIFENLQASGFKLADRCSFLDYDHLSLMLRKLGNFHACSYKAKEKDYTSFRILCDLFADAITPVYRKNELLSLEAKYRLQECQKKYPQYSQKLLKAENLISSMPEFLEQVFNKNKNSRMSVLCHRDYLRGNIMFKYVEGKPIDLKVVDMATCALASPVVDLAQVLYVNADQQMRNEHWDDLIDDYCAGLREYSEGIEIPSRNDILEEFRDNSFFAYQTACIYLWRAIAVDDNKMEMYEEFDNISSEDAPLAELVAYGVKLGGELASEAISNVLKDMMDRSFV